jgi:flagellar protein FlaC
MGLFDNLKGLGKKKKETTVNVPQNPLIPPPTETQQSTQSFDSKFIDGVNQRISAVENEVSKLNVSMETAKRNISEIKEELEKMKENVKMVVSLYEMVSKKFNPFMDVTPEEIKEVTEVLRENIQDLERMVHYAIDDLKELYGAPDLDDMITDIEHQEDTNDQ